MGVTALAIGLVGILPATAAASAPDSNVGTAEPSVQVPLKPAAGQQDPQASGPAALAAVCQFPVSATNPYMQSKTVTSVDARFYSSTDWTPLECGQLTVSVPRGHRAGLVVDVSAEVTCTGPAPDQTQWCQGRVMVGNTEAHPRVTEADGSFAWAQSSNDVGAWESNAFERSLTLSCPASTTTQTPCVWPVRVDVRNHTTGLNFRVDDSSVHAGLTYQ
jgi:hypothetical protein